MPGTPSSTSLRRSGPSGYAIGLTTVIPYDRWYKICAIEHPTGKFVSTVTLSDDAGAGPPVERAGIVRTTRKLFEGKVFIHSAPGDRAA
jgi:2-methylaconitate cis-trans-isomerase PrpF